MWEGNKNLNNNQYRLASSVLFFFCDSHHRVFSLPFFREGKRGRKRKKNINAWLPFMRPHRGIWPTTQACALTGNRTGDPLVHRSALNPLNHTSHGAPKVLGHPQSVVRDRKIARPFSAQRMGERGPVEQ